MERRYLKLQIQSNGAAKCTQNTFKCTVNLPPKWIKEMGITPDNRKVVLSFYSEEEKYINISKFETENDIKKENEVLALLKVRKNTQNSYAWSIRIRWSWVKEMNLTKEDNLLIVSYNNDTKEIIIQKANK